MADLKSIKNDLSAEDVRSALDYDPETGVFTWRWREGVSYNINRRYSGTVAGNKFKSKRTSYIRLRINTKLYQAHRLAWIHYYGEWPDGCLDHIDGDGTNNKISNLRLATHSQNNANQRLRRTSLIGLKGVTLHRTGKFQSRICADGKQRHLGLFETAEEAHAAYVKEAKRLFGDFARRS